MKIHALTVCVDYADYLSLSVDRWRHGLDSWTIVTTTKDAATAELAAAKGLRLHKTDVFYAGGAAFNKGAAMEEARLGMPWEDWVLFLDADIAPQVDWRVVLELNRPSPGRLYSAWRHQCEDPSSMDDQRLPRITGDGVGVGYFQLFHVSDPVLTGPLPLIETHWLHAGNYDNGFMHRWSRENRVLLPIRLVHFGSRDNWWGRGNKEAFAAMLAERSRRGGRWDHERIAPD